MGLYHKKTHRVSPFPNTYVIHHLKAFDSVPHQRLLEKLRYYGVGGRTNRLISSLLSDRRQRVVINGTRSEWVPVRSGVPQGTVIGPILFLIYINDIRCGIESKMRLFADDSIIYREIKSEADHLALMNDLLKLQEWSSRWQMVFKPEKCFVMSITNRTNPSLYTYSMNNTPLTLVESWTYLGAIIDSKLNWNQHIEHVRKSAQRSLNVIQRTLHAAPSKIKQMAYQTLVRPKLEYASAAWSPHTTTNINKLERVQNKAARFVSRSYDYHTSVSGLKRDLGWADLSVRRKAHDCTLWFKIHHGYLLIPFPFPVQQKSRLARNNHDLAYQQLNSRVNCYFHSFFIRTIPIWNGLNSSLVHSENSVNFQSAVLAHLRAGALP